MEPALGFATPATTIGMGNLSMPGENGEVGSGDIFPTETSKKKKKMKSLKEYIKSKNNVGS